MLMSDAGMTEPERETCRAACGISLGAGRTPLRLAASAAPDSLFSVNKIYIVILIEFSYYNVWEYIVNLHERGYES